MKGKIEKKKEEVRIGTKKKMKECINRLILKRTSNLLKTTFYVWIKYTRIPLLLM